LYADSWNFSKFQANKPNTDRSDFNFWIWESPELQQLQSVYHKAMNNLAAGIDPTLLDGTCSNPVLQLVCTRRYPILSLK